MKQVYRKYSRTKRDEMEFLCCYFNVYFPLLLHLRLTSQPPWIACEPHILFPIISGREVFHSLFDGTHAGGAESIASARVFHWNTIIKRDIEDFLPLFCSAGRNLAGEMEVHLCHSSFMINDQ
ncbi:hypothetical protein A3D11_00185 [Candidatus Peribacteria bacterium RIFCSPHIGHO2_02_FULL_49_16]|nr:MAG: hypothetical protein A3D11_00185 [Candidatus Peribacteria bacterium RIFCSPHIGHO2_02_FULL_49_16]